jgi:hypothetical protein
MIMMKKNKEELLQEQNELIKQLVASLEDIKAGRIKPFK